MNFKSLTRNIIVTASLTALMAVSAYAYDVQGGTVITSSAVNFREEASVTSECLDKLYDGARVAILDKQDGWYKVAFDGTVGYMSADYIAAQPIMNIECGGAKVTTSALNVRSGPGTENSIVTKMYEGAIGKIIGINNGWFKIQYKGETGYISPDYVSIVPYTSASTRTSSTSNNYVATSSANGTRQQIIDYAAKFLGCKYVYGGTTPNGFDCSGYVQYVYKHFGINLVRTSYNQYATCQKISKSELKLGDLVFFSQNAGSSKVGHVGMYVGGGQFIHAASPGKGVRYDSLNSSYYSARYIGSGRFINN